MDYMHPVTDYSVIDTTHTEQHTPFQQVTGHDILQTMFITPHTLFDNSNFSFLLDVHADPDPLSQREYRDSDPPQVQRVPPHRPRECPGLLFATPQVTFPARRQLSRAAVA